DVMIHSKVMIIDDHFLRIGSANLNNRSMGADTECDLSIEAADDGQRAAIAAVRDRLLGEHCGVPAEELAEALARDPSFVRLVDTLSRDGHCLRPIDDGRPDRGLLPRLAERVADPARPLRLSRLMGHLLPRLLAVEAGSPLAPLMVVVGFVLAGCVAFPVIILILVTAALFGPWLGMAYAAAGVAASAGIFYAVGTWLGSEQLRRLAGRRWPRLSRWLKRRGLLAVVALRVVPMAPFTVVNLAIGASGIGLVDFAAGTLIGMGPGLVALSFVGDRIVEIVRNPGGSQLWWLALAAGAWIAVAFGAQALVARFGGQASRDAG
ncbi:MAG TPA: VTT domain-containing protein, partial [Reyranella sp.]|nr:VTT domain-containing protein [Reyranella sp.]